MKKLFSLILLLFVLVACGKGEIKVYSVEEIADFDMILENVGTTGVKAYDLREYEECYAGRVPGFFCARIYEFAEEDNIFDEIVNNLELILGSKKDTLIILMDNDGSQAEYVANKLFEKGYSNIHYFKEGYEKYVELHPGFVPESGDCDC